MKTSFLGSFCPSGSKSGVRFPSKILVAEIINLQALVVRNCRLSNTQFACNFPDGITILQHKDNVRVKFKRKGFMMKRQVKVVLKWEKSASITVIIYFLYDCLYLDIFVTNLNLILLIVMECKKTVQILLWYYFLICTTL